MNPAQEFSLVVGLGLLFVTSCGDPTPVGIPIPPAAIVVRGTVVGQGGEVLPLAQVESWAIISRPGGSNSDQFAQCKGQRESDISRATSDSLGQFVATVPVANDVLYFCLVVRVQPPSGSTFVPTGIALDSQRVRVPGLPPRDTLRVQVVLSTSAQ